ncbi:MAG: serine/threonine protein kinase [Pseudomonadota bacterium]
MQDTEFFFSLTQDGVLDAVEAEGFLCTGRCFALNSYENRVYEVELEGEGTPIERKRVIKFYRPGRWTIDQILEEHEFLRELKEAEIPVVWPLTFADGATLHVTKETHLAYAIFPKVGGRQPDELDEDQSQWLGRLIARIHNVGAGHPARHRIHLDLPTYGLSNLDFLLRGEWLPPVFSKRFEAAVLEICRLSQAGFPSEEVQRIHGDCHMGNLLWDTKGPFFLDFDDMVTGPPVQDVWLLTPGRDELAQEEREALLDGYTSMRAFDRRTLKWVETLRALRYVHFSTWIARRWKDPAFPIAFPHFNTPKYWEEKTHDLEEQVFRVREALEA